MIWVFNRTMRKTEWETTAEIRFFLLWATIDVLKSKDWYELSVADA